MIAEEKKDATEAPAEGAEGAEGGEGAAAPKKSKKKLIIIIVAALVVVGGGAGAFLSGAFTQKKEEVVDPNLIEKTVYYDMDEFLVNLNNPGNQVSFLKTTITLELPNQATMNEVQSKLPRIRDTFQIYLRELRSSDLQGSAGIQRLRAELLLRINNLLEDNKVNDILFKEIIVQ
jgi:flagellar FliL protein